MAQFSLANQMSINVFKSRLAGGWNWHLLRGGAVVSGGVGFATESDAYAAAMASR